MRAIGYRKLISASVLVLGLSAVGAASPLFAQDTGYATTTTRTDDRDDGMDLGWIGLLGLAGLLGLRRRERVERVERVDRVDPPRTRP